MAMLVSVFKNHHGVLIVEPLNKRIYKKLKSICLMTNGVALGCVILRDWVPPKIKKHPKFENLQADQSFNMLVELWEFSEWFKTESYHGHLRPNKPSKRKRKTNRPYKRRKNAARAKNMA